MLLRECANDGVKDTTVVEENEIVLVPIMRVDELDERQEVSGRW